MERILIVDDELAILSGLSKALHELCDFQGDVRTVVNGREAIHETRHCFYDICFLDIKLPDINGLNVLKDIKDISPETKIVLMSASYMRGEIEKIIENGEAFYIEKPFNFPQIKHLMKLALGGNGDFYKSRETGRQEGMSRERKHKRRPMAKIISFYVKDPNLTEFKGCITDISYSGVGIETSYPLERGHRLSFSSGLGNKTGIVVWSNNGNDNN
jgi:DNA-binding NtrC family response regulator